MLVIVLTMVIMKDNLSQKRRSYLISYIFLESSENTTRAAWPWFMSLWWSFISEQPEEEAAPSNIWASIDVLRAYGLLPTSRRI